MNDEAFGEQSLEGFCYAKKKRAASKQLSCERHYAIYVLLVWCRSGMIGITLIGMIVHRR